MSYSKKYKLLFIASPKSGSSSIEKFFKEVDPHGENHSLTMPNKKITSKDMHYGVVGHARAWELKHAVGKEFYNELHGIGMVRHPMVKLVSSYYFNKKNYLFQAFKMRGEKNLLLRKIKGFMTSLAPKILPINIWALIFPMKTSYEYFFDRNGHRIVTYLGRTDHLNEDLKLILKKLKISTSVETPHINTSKHNHRQDYFKNRWIRNKLYKKYKKDIDLYQQVELEMQKLKKELNA